MNKDLSVEELVADPSFKNWVLNPGSVNNVYWEKLAEENKVNLKTIREARILVLVLEQPKTEFTSEDESILWDRLQSSIEEKVDKEKKIISLNSDLKKPASNLRRRNWQGYIVAASITILVTLYFSLNLNDKKPEEVQPLTSTVEKGVAKGQKLKLYLPDGSKVALNSLSKISYPERFDSAKRVVEVEGEVYFEVMKDSLKPFIVKSKNMITEVIGTTFNIHAYPTSEQETISLLEGKVKVTLVNNDETISDDKEITLKPGEEIKHNGVSGTFLKGRIENPDELLWMEGVLAFHNEPLPEVFDKLEMWYGVEFIFNDELPRDEVLTGKFRNEYLDNVLQSINYTVTFDYEIDGDSVYVNF